MSTPDPESTAEREGIVDQQDAVLEPMQEIEEREAEPGGKVDPMAGEAPTGWCAGPRPGRARVGSPVGLWRSLVAHLTGGQGVAGSNPVTPTGSEAL